MGARVRHEVVQAQLLGATQFLDERLDRVPVKGRVGRREVDEVGVVGGRLADHGPPEDAAKLARLVGRDRLGGPLIRGFGEDLHRPAAAGLGRQQGIVIAAGDRHVSAKKRHPGPISPRQIVDDGRRCAYRCCNRTRRLFRPQSREGPMDPIVTDWLWQAGRVLTKLLPGGILTAWCLWAVDWRKAWPVLAAGGWVPLVLIGVMAGAVWSLVWPTNALVFGMVTVPNGLWQLGAVGVLIAVALFCGWVQTHYGRPPAEVDLAPRAAAHHHADS